MDHAQQPAMTIADKSRLAIIRSKKMLDRVTKAHTRAELDCAAAWNAQPLSVRHLETGRRAALAQETGQFDDLLSCPHVGVASVPR